MKMVHAHGVQTAVILLLVGIIFQTHGQPLRTCTSEYDFFCRLPLPGGEERYPREHVILLDTHDHLNLFDPFQGCVVWRTRENDLGPSKSDGRTWQQVIGGTCSWGLHSCTYQHNFPNQNNWLFSRYIDLKDSKQLLFSIGDNFRRCQQDPRCLKEYFTFHRYVVEDEDEDISSQVNIENYEYIYPGNSTQSRVGPTSAGSGIMKINRPSGKGMYLGISDTGSCGTITRLIIYYIVCLGKQTELVVYPKTPTPPDNGPDQSFLASCVANAHNVTSLSIHAFSKNSTCRDEVEGGAKCKCNNGYEISENRKSCDECKKGYYRFGDVVSTCQKCPLNTVSSPKGASHCECINDYFRSDKEGLDSPCTTSPSAPNSLKVDGMSSNEITLSWECPTSLGGRDSDISFSVCYSKFNSENLDDLTCEDNIIYTPPCGHQEFTISNLQSFTDYIIYVSSHNGVSNKDADNAHNREVRVLTQTTEGIPGAPILKRLCTVVIWKPPVAPNGKIVTYELCFGMNDQGVNCWNYSATDNFHITSEDQRASNALVMIRVYNNHAASSFTDFLPIECSNQECNPTTSTAPPTTASTAPPTTASTAPPTTASTAPPTTASTAPPTTSSTAPPTTASTAPPTTASTAPPTTASTAPPTTASTAPPTTASTAPPTMASTAPPTTIPGCEFESPPSFELGGIAIQNGSMVNLDDIGTGEDALHCTTPYLRCCKAQIKGEFFYPNGTRLNLRRDRTALFRNRDDGFIRLNHNRASTEDPGLLGQYTCEIPDACGVLVYLHITLE